MGHRIQRGMGQAYFDTSAFCEGIRAGTISTIVPATECWDLVTGPEGGAQGPPAPGTQYGPPAPGPVFRTTVTANAPGFPWWILLAVAGVAIVAKKA